MKSGDNNTIAKYLPVEELDPTRVKKFVKYVIKKEFWKNEDDNYEIEENIKRKKIEKVVLISKDDPTQCHKYRGFNKFTTKKFPIPTEEKKWLGYEKYIKLEYESRNLYETFEKFSDNFMEYQKREILNSICNPNFSLWNIDRAITFGQYEFWKMYRTLDNFIDGFIVFVSNDDKIVHVYDRTLDVLPYKQNINDIRVFNRLILSCEPIEVFIGKSDFNEMTKYNKFYGEDWDGNSILLRIDGNKDLTTSIEDNTHNYRYVYIGSVIYEFTTDEEITTYVSSVNNNFVPYPYAESKNWCYDMDTSSKTHIKYHPERKIIGYIGYDKEAECESLKVERIAERSHMVCKTEFKPKK